MTNETIFALASGAGRAGVSVFRVSGPASADIIQSLTQKPLPQSHDAVLRSFKQANGSLIDEGLLLWMPGPGSFTGEDVAEFHTHGSPAVIELMAEALLAAGARQAGPGEFTRRAFDNGRMDLTEAEGLADLIDAETSGQHQQALRQMQGGLKTLYETWRLHLIDALASIEGEIDFPDEADVPDVLAHRAYGPIESAKVSMLTALDNVKTGERIRAGIEIAIIGPPNAGKSTLLNWLAGRDAAIVSDIAGTTRDVIDVDMVIGGLAVRLSDTAGLRDSDDIIESEGVRRALNKAKTADIRMAVIDGSDGSKLEDWSDILKDKDILLINKSDKDIDENLKPPLIENTYKISASTGEGMATFKQALTDLIADRFPISQTAGLTRARHKDCVSRAHEALNRAQTQLVNAPELAGDDIRAALHAIKELAGETDIEAVLDKIFSRFCIGK